MPWCARRDALHGWWLLNPPALQASGFVIFNLVAQVGAGREGVRAAAPDAARQALPCCVLLLNGICNVMPKGLVKASLVSLLLAVLAQSVVCVPLRAPAPPPWLLIAQQEPRAVERRVFPAQLRSCGRAVCVASRRPQRPAVANPWRRQA